MMRRVIRTLVAALGLTLIQAVVAALLPLSAGPPEGAHPGFVAASNLLTAGVLLAVARRLRGSGWPRAIVLFALPFGVAANNLLEGVFFSLDIPPAALPVLFGNALAVTLGFSWLADRLAGNPTGSTASPWPSDRGPGQWALRVAACDLGYVAVYLVAGLLVWPFVQWFYSGRALPGLGSVVLVQLLRGLVFIALLVVLLSRLAVRPAAAALLCGILLSVLGGVAPLLMPNPYMSAALRMPHLVEVGLSNLLFGWFVGKVLGAASPQASAAPSPAVSSSA